MNVTVTEVNDPPVALDDTVSILPDAVTNIQVLANDLSGPDNEMDQMLTLVSVSDPANGQVVINPDGSLTYTPDAGFAGTELITYTVADNGTTNGLLDPLTSTATLEVVVAPPALVGDFNQDTVFDCDDINQLSAAIATSSADLLFDLNSDSLVNFDDLLQWLAIAGAVNQTSGQPYLLGDADLDGFVDGNDFITWNDHKFEVNNAYCSGDFNADGFADGNDFIIWNDSKFTSSNSATAPATGGSTVETSRGAATQRKESLPTANMHRAPAWSQPGPNDSPAAATHENGARTSRSESAIDDIMALFGRSSFGDL